MGSTEFKGPGSMLPLDQDRITIKVARLPHNILGLVLILVGGFVVYRVVRPLPGKSFHPGLLALGLLLAGFGIRSLMRGGCALDRKTRTVVKWWGFLVPLYRRTIPWSELRGVRIKSSRIAGSFFVAGDCHVLLEGPSGPIPVRHVRDITEAREWAYSLSLYLEVPDLGEEGFTL